MKDRPGTGTSSLTGSPRRSGRARTSSGPDTVFTPDGRYLIVRDRLSRAANPGLDADLRSGLVKALMEARREVGAALRAKDDARLARASAAVDAAKVSLGERGPVWWTDGGKDFNRHLVKNTPYASWYQQLLPAG